MRLIASIRCKCIFQIRWQQRPSQFSNEKERSSRHIWFFLRSVSSDTQNLKIDHVTSLEYSDHRQSKSKSVLVVRTWCVYKQDGPLSISDMVSIQTLSVILVYESDELNNVSMWTDVFHERNFLRHEKFILLRMSIWNLTQRKPQYKNHTISHCELFLISTL